MYPLPGTIAWPRRGSARLEGPIDSFDQGSLEATIPPSSKPAMSPAKKTEPWDAVQRVWDKERIHVFFSELFVTVYFGLADEKKTRLKHQIKHTQMATDPTVLQEISNQNKIGLEVLLIRTGLREL